MKNAVYALIATLALTAVLAPTAGNAAADQTLTTAQTTIDRDKPRVPGGSGCDDPDDIIEHPECR